MCYLWCLCTWLRIKLCICDCMFCVMLCGVVFIGLFIGGYCVCCWWFALTLNCWVGVELCCLLVVNEVVCVVLMVALIWIVYFGVLAVLHKWCKRGVLHACVVCIMSSRYGGLGCVSLFYY